MKKIFLLLGTNIGDLKTNLLGAMANLQQKGIRIIKKSKIYKTAPWGNKNQPDFLNMAIEVECDYSPTELLRVIKEIEKKMGRKATAKRWQQRIIDIDILFYGEKIINNKNLTVPHKEFYNRPFAIKPLAEISPDFIPPLSKKSLKHYLSEIDDARIEIYCN